VDESDADQAEAILTRWGPDGFDKLGGERPSSHNIFPFLTIIIYSCVRPTLGYTYQKTRVREANQARAINEVVNALKPEQQTANGEDSPLLVVNGVSTQKFVCNHCGREGECALLYR
jgi:hypothetical protein